VIAFSPVKRVTNIKQASTVFAPNCFVHFYVFIRLLKSGFFTYFAHLSRESVKQLKPTEPRWVWRLCRNCRKKNNNDSSRRT